MKTIVEGVLAGALPWGLVLSGSGLAVGAWLCGVSPLAFSIGVYLPLASMAAIYVGGCVRALYDRRSSALPATTGGDPGVLAASGLVAGEALAGILVAGLVAMGLAPRAGTPVITNLSGDVAVVVVVVIVCAFLLRARPPAVSARTGDARRP
jgi:uncharacterized oligopeptide transporter (OPT) family protein